MKYGIDINNKNILDEIIEYLKEVGDFSVNLSEEDINYNRQINYGKVLMKKVLKANVTKIDLYFKIEFLDEISEILIYFSSGDKAKRIGNSIGNVLASKFVGINMKEGESLYVLKNINTLGIVLKFPKKIMEEVDLDIVKEILKIIKIINE